MRIFNFGSWSNNQNYISWRKSGSVWNLEPRPNGWKIMFPLKSSIFWVFAYSPISHKPEPICRMSLSLRRLGVSFSQSKMCCFTPWIQTAKCRRRPVLHQDAGPRNERSQARTRLIHKPLTDYSNHSHHVYESRMSTSLGANWIMLAPA
jgi:hypothetical protein